MDEFDERFDALYSALQDKRDYLESKNYYWDGFSYRWEPRDPVDLEPEEPTFPPGAMRVGELDDYDFSDYDEF